MPSEKSILQRIVSMTSFYQKMKIRTQIFSGFLLVLFLTLILSVVTIYYLGNLGNASTRILEENYRSVKASEQILISLSKIDQILSKVCLGNHYNDSSLIAILDREKQILSNNLAICRQNATGQKEVRVVSQMEDEYASYIHHIDDFKNTVDRVGLYFTVLQRLNEVIRENCVQLVELNHSDLRARDEYAQTLYFQSKLYIFLIMVLVLMIAGWTVYKVPHEIVKPLTKITEKIKRISQGEYQQEIKVDSSSELGELALAFNDMSVRLQEFEKLNIEEVQIQKSRMESIIRSMNDGLIILDEQEEIILVNETSSHLIDMDESELIGKKLWELAEKNEVLYELEASLSKKEFRPASMQESHSFLKINKEDGKSAFYTKEIFKVYSKDTAVRKFLGHIITLKDITSFKESDEAKSNFIAVVSHELKTPLSALNMSLMLLSNTRFGSLNEEQSKTVNSMKREVQRLVNMVTELLDLSRVENGRITLDKEHIKPSILIEYAIAPVEVKFKQKDVLIVKKVDEKLPEIFIDPEKISWVLINLMTNALRYSPEGGKIILEAKKVKNMVEFSVKDYGPGIAKDNLKRVFNKFVQLNTNGKKNKHGLGLGLAISKEVVQAHEGQIFVESEVGAWSKFYFQVPIYLEDGKVFQQPENRKSLHLS